MKTYLLSSANQGIGPELSRQLAEQGLQQIIAIYYQFSADLKKLISKIKKIEEI